jgi:acetolactate synthase I/III small subunit
MKRHTIIALMQDQPGVLNRAVSLFRRRGYNIASLAVGHTEIPNISRMTVVVESDEVEQVVKQLDRLVEVVDVTDVTYEQTVDREMALLKVGVLNGNRAEIVALCEVFNAKVVDVTQESMIIEMTGSPAKVENFIEVMEPFSISEMMRTGVIAMVRGAKTSHARMTHSADGNGRVTAETLR